MRGHGRVFKIPPNHQHHGDLDRVSRSFLTVNRLFPHISHFLAVSPLHPSRSADVDVVLKPRVRPQIAFDHPSVAA